MIGPGLFSLVLPRWSTKLPDASGYFVCRRRHSPFLCCPSAYVSPVKQISLCTCPLSLSEIIRLGALSWTYIRRFSRYNKLVRSKCRQRGSRSAMIEFNQRRRASILSAVVWFSQIMLANGSVLWPKLRTDSSISRELYTPPILTKTTQGNPQLESS